MIIADQLTASESPLIPVVVSGGAATIGLDDITLVDTPDALLVSRNDRVQDVRQVVKQLKQDGQESYRWHRTAPCWKRASATKSSASKSNPAPRCRCKCTTTAASTESWSATPPKWSAATRNS